MINKDRIVPVTKTDLLYLYATMLFIANDQRQVKGVDATGVGVFDLNAPEGDEALFCSEPVKSMNVNITSSKTVNIYFVPATDFEGVTINGKPADVSASSDEVIANGTVLYVLIVNGSGGGVFIARKSGFNYWGD